MKAALDCYPCFLSQALGAARLVTRDEELIGEILQRVGLALPGFSFDRPPPEIGREIYRLVSEMTGVDDPFTEAKRQCTHQAKRLYPEMKKIVTGAEDRLLTAVRLAIAGNVIDFGSNTPFDLKKDTESILSQELAIDHYPSFGKDMAAAQNVLYLADNAGETVFDRLLVEELGVPVTYAVRSRPVINDAVFEDAVEAGLDEVARIVSSGCDVPGNALHLCSPEFLEIYRSSDLIISKGQGNYECLSDERGSIYFLLKAKCVVVARHLGVPQGSIILKKGNAPLVLT